MGKTARKLKHSQKMNKKRAAKAARRALYTSLKGTSRKKKRQTTRATISGTYKHAHVMGDCGNTGCDKCYPRFAITLHGAIALAA